MKNYKLFSGTANLPLAQKVAKELGVKLGKVEIIRFADGESRVWVEEDVKDKVVYLLQPFSPPVDENLLEFLLLADALKRGWPKKLIGIVPYYGYARQDKVFRKGEALSAQVVAKMIEAVGLEKLVTLHLHSLRILNFFKIPVVHLSTVPIFARVLANLKKEKDKWMVVAPDEVALKEVRNLAKILNFPTAYLEKKRDYSQKDKPKTVGLIGDVTGCKAIMYDDLSSTGGTIINGAKLLKEKGAETFMVALGHLVVSQVAEKIADEKSVDKIFITDTIPYVGKKLKKLEIVSVAPLIASVIKDTIDG